MAKKEIIPQAEVVINQIETVSEEVATPEETIKDSIPEVEQETEVEKEPFDINLLSIEQIKILERYIKDFEEGNMNVVNLIQHWSSLPSKLDCGRFPEINEYLKDK